MFLQCQTQRPSRDGIFHAVAPSHFLSLGPGSLELNRVFVMLVWSMFDVRRCRFQVMVARSGSQEISLAPPGVSLDAFAHAHLRAGSFSCAADLRSLTSPFFCPPSTKLDSSVKLLFQSTLLPVLEMFANSLEGATESRITFQNVPQAGLLARFSFRLPASVVIVMSAS